MLQINRLDYLIEDCVLEEDGFFEEEYVYDLVMEDERTPYFFGNGILIHNSAFFGLKKVVDKKFPNGVEDEYEVVKFLDEYCQKIKDNIYSKGIQEFAYNLNSYKPEILDVDREKITSETMMLGKKTYFMKVLDNEGVTYATPELFKRGITLVKSSTPAFVRREVTKVLDVIMKGSNDELLDWLEQMKTDYFKADPRDIAKTSNVSSMDYNLETGRSNKMSKGKYLPIPVQSRAALVHNQLLEKYGLKQRKISPGDKIKLLYLKTPNPLNQNVIGFIDPSVFKDSGFDKYIDYDKNWEKSFIPNVEILIKPLRWKIERVNSLDEW